MLIEKDEYKLNKLLKYLVFAIIAIQLIVYLDAIFSKLKIKNEFFYLDEQTKLIDNTFVSNHTFDKKYLTFDKNISNAKYTSLDIYVNIHDPFDINEIPKFHIFPYIKYGNIYEKNSILHYKSSDYYRLFKYDLNGKSLMNSFYQYYYKNGIKVAESYNKNIKHNLNIIQKIYRTRNYAMKSTLPESFEYPLFKAKTESELKKIADYINKNYDEKILQMLDRYYFHESSFVLTPINEYKLGKPINKIFSQYGFLSILSISKIMDLFGGYSIVNYEKTLKFIYLLYYVIFLFFIFKFFKTYFERYIMVVILGISLYLNSFYFFQYSPGHVPFRHMLDILLIYILYKYESESKDKLLFILGLGIAILSIYIDKENGMLMWLTFLATYTISNIVLYIQRKNFLFTRILSILAILTLGIIAISLYPLSSNPSAKYFIDGFYSFRIYGAFYGVLLVITLGWISIILFWKKLIKLKIFKLYLFTTIYAQLSYFYFVWGGGNAHFIVLLPIYILPWAILISKINFKYKKIFLIIVAVIATLIYAKGLNSFLFQRYNNEKVFKNHKTYEWNFNRAGGLISTVNPSEFEDSIDLIKKYDKTKEIAMISKYDNILSIFSKKYTKLPFFELRSFIVTKTDYKKVIKALKKSDTIFVDNDIERDFDNELNNPNLWTFFMFNENIKQRIPKLRVLKSLFEDIKSQYKLVKKGKLISVYKRK